MNRLIALFIVGIGLAGCAPKSDLSAVGVREEIEYRYEPSFAPSWIIHLERDSHGKITGTLFRSGNAEDSPRVKISTFASTSAVFERLAAAVESKEFKEVSERFPSAGNDGYAFIFTRRMGNREVRFRVWGARSEYQPTRTAAQLADSFLKAAGIGSIDELQKKKPNQAPEPTAPSGRGSS